MDNDVLFAILVVQHHFSDRTQVVDGYRHWSKNRSGSFASYLVEQKILSALDRDLLQPLHAAWIARNQGDAQKSVDELSALGSMVTELLDALKTDNGDSATLAWRATNHRSNSTRLGNASSQSDLDTSPRFRVLRPHAKGGLGEVSVARDIELNREVALKEIQSRFVHDPGSRARFMMEAEVTGRLEHPGIVPVYGLGSYSDGRPFYAMRFIQGDSLKEAITAFHAVDCKEQSASEKRLAQRQLLQRFVDVCDAIEFAHSRGVLHRDIKPGNIMLGKYGETLVVDWGLAKLSGVNDPETQAGSISLSSSGDHMPTMAGTAVGTPAYMPPEQAKGEVERLGPASDIYSLGATLYHLLTGQPPFDGRDLAKILESVRNGHFPPPRSRIADIPKPLEAICLKAMALEPIDRYSTARQLAEDVERYLGDEPVSSMKESWSAKVSRWIRKRPTTTAAVVSAIAVASVGMVVFTSIVGRKNQELRTVNSNLDVKNFELQASIEREKQATEAALASAHLAQEQSQLALETLQGVVREIQSSVKELPGSNRLRQRLLTTSLEQLTRVANDYVSHSQIDLNTWQALQEMGSLVLEFGIEEVRSIAKESEPEVSAKSALRMAEGLFRRAIEIARSLESQAIDKSPDRLRCATSLSDLSSVQLRLGDLPAAVVSIAEAIQIKQSSGVLKSPEMRRDLVIDITQLGQLHLQMGDSEQAIQTTQNAIVVADKLLREESSPEVLDALAIAHERLGMIHTFLQDFPIALQELENALQRRESLLQMMPDDLLMRYGMANLLDALGEVYGALKRTEDSLATLNRAHETREKMHLEESENWTFRRSLVATLDRLGDTYMILEQYPVAMLAYEEGRNHRRILLDVDNENQRMKRELALSHEKIGSALLFLEKYEQAESSQRESLAIRDELARQYPKSATAQRDVMVTHVQLANISLAQSRWDEAEGHLRSAIATSRKMIDEGLNVGRSQGEYEMLLKNLEEVQAHIPPPQ